MEQAGRSNCCKLTLALGYTDSALLETERYFTMVFLPLKG